MTLRVLLLAVLAGAILLGQAFPQTVITPGTGQDDELPDAPGRKVLLRACTTCHDLDEVTKFKGYYTRTQWKDIVVTMKEYGATLDEAEVEPLAEYLFAALGKKE
jgi:hypothetical protein